MSNPLLGQPKTDEHLEWKRISQTLKRNLFYPCNDQHKHEQKLIEVFEEYCQQITETVNRTYFINHLCSAYYTDNDEPFMFYKPLTQQLNYTKLNKRHQFYHILLHRYVPLSELNPSNVTKILPRIIQKHTAFAHVKTSDIQQIVEEKSIDGSKLVQIVRNNQLAETFGSCSVSISDVQWREIRCYIKGWELNVSQITIECIPKTLQECNTHHLILVLYMIAKENNRKSSKPFDTPNIEAFLTQNKMNGNQIQTTSKAFVDKAKEEPYKIPPGDANLIHNEIVSYFDGKRDCAGAPSRTRTIPEPRDDGKQFNANQILLDEKKSEMEQDTKLAIAFDAQADDGGEKAGLIDSEVADDSSDDWYNNAPPVYEYGRRGGVSSLKRLSKAGLVGFLVIRIIVPIIALVMLNEMKSIWGPFDDDAIKEQCNGEIKAFLYIYGKSEKVHPDVYFQGWMFFIFIAVAYPVLGGLYYTFQRFQPRGVSREPLHYLVLYSLVMCMGWIPFWIICLTLNTKVIDHCDESSAIYQGNKEAFGWILPIAILDLSFMLCGCCLYCYYAIG
eukprot:610086_1